MRCYAPSTSVTVAILFLGYLTLRHTAAHALAGAGLATGIIIVVAACLFATALTVIVAATIRHRRAAAGACYTCGHPCRQEPAPSWPHRPLTRSTLPVIVIPQQSPPPAPELARATAASPASGRSTAHSRASRAAAGGGAAANSTATTGGKATANSSASRAAASSGAAASAGAAIARPAEGHTLSRSR